MSGTPGPVPAPRPVHDEVDVPFWIVLVLDGLAGVGAGAFRALAGVAPGSWLRSRR